MKIGLAQYKFINNDIKYNLSQIEKAMIKASGEVDLLCFGESFLQGFDSLCWEYEKDKDVALSLDSQEFKQICSLSKEYDIAILVGYIEKDTESIYSSYVFINDGIIEKNYRRLSIGWKEYSKTDEHYKEGEELVYFSYKGHDFLVALCGDLWDESMERFKTDAVVLWPVYLNFGLEDWIQEEKEYALQASKISSRVLMVNSLSAEPISRGGTFDFKDGRIINKLPYDLEDILIIEL